MAPDTGQLVAQILNDWWMVRNYVRGGRSAIHCEQRDQAIMHLGLTIERAFSVCPKTPRDLETILAAVLDGGRPHNEKPF